MKIVILAGGKGSRLGLSDLPKPMVPIENIPLLERTIRMAVAQGFRDFILLTGYCSEAIETHFGNGSAVGANVRYIVEEQPLGTAGCFRLLRDELREPFVVIYGDILLDVDLAAFVRFSALHGGAGSLFVHPNDHPHDSDLLEVDGDNRIVSFHSKPHPDRARYPNLVSAAIYVLDPQALEYIPDGMSDWGRDVFPRLTKELPLYAYRSCEYAKDIGTPERLKKASRHLREGRVHRLSRAHAKPVIFVDRDGVINEERGGVLTPGDVRLLPNVASSLRRFNDAGIPIICVTNQPFLAKGQISWAGLRAVTGEIDHQLAEEAGAYIDDLRVCPHHPEKGWDGEIAELKVECACRKPKPGMIVDAAKFHNIDLAHSWLIGDRYCDLAAAQAAGVKAALVRTGHAGDDRDQFLLEPHEIFDDLAQASDVILESML